MQELDRTYLKNYTSILTHLLCKHLCALFPLEVHFCDMKFGNWHVKLFFIFTSPGDCKSYCTEQN